MRYDGISGVRTFIMQIRDIANHLVELEIPIAESFLVHQVLSALLSSFSNIKSIYNTQKETWTVNKLIGVCVQEEKKIERERSESVNFVHQPHVNMEDNKNKSSHHHHKKNKFRKKFKGKGNASNPGAPKPDIKKNNGCWF